MVYCLHPKKVKKLKKQNKFTFWRLRLAPCLISNSTISVNPDCAAIPKGVFVSSSRVSSQDRG